MTTLPFSGILTLLLVTGCAATIPSELAMARRAYQQASTGPAATLVPAELHKAQDALEQAEAAFRDDPRGYHTVDLAYVARRKSELAQALAATATQSAKAASANSQFQATQDAIMKDTRLRLDASELTLAASQTSEAKATADLAASNSARAVAETRARDALAALSRLAAVKEESRGVVITLSGSVLFRSAEAELLTDAQQRLGEVATALMETGDRDLLIEGHTDSQGSDTYNRDLAQRRAEAVRAFLAGRGYDAKRIRASGIGEARPVADNATAEGRANNRRVEIIIVPLVTAAQ